MDPFAIVCICLAVTNAVVSMVCFMLVAMIGVAVGWWAAHRMRYLHNRLRLMRRLVARLLICRDEGYEADSEHSDSEPDSDDYSGYYNPDDDDDDDGDSLLAPQSSHCGGGGGGGGAGSSALAIPRGLRRRFPVAYQGGSQQLLTITNGEPDDMFQAPRCRHLRNSRRGTNQWFIRSECLDCGMVRRGWNPRRFSGLY